MLKARGALSDTCICLQSSTPFPAAQIFWPLPFCLFSFLLFIYFYLFIFWFFETGFLCSFGACPETSYCRPGWSRTHRDPPASVSRVLGLRCAPPSPGSACFLIDPRSFSLEATLTMNWDFPDQSLHPDLMEAFSQLRFPFV